MASFRSLPFSPLGSDQKSAERIGRCFFGVCGEEGWDVDGAVGEIWREASMRGRRIDKWDSVILELTYLVRIIHYLPFTSFQQTLIDDGTNPILCIVFIFFFFSYSLPSLLGYPSEARLHNIINTQQDPLFFPQDLRTPHKIFDMSTRWVARPLVRLGKFGT